MVPHPSLPTTPLGKLRHGGRVGDHTAGHFGANSLSAPPSQQPRGVALKQSEEQGCCRILGWVDARLPWLCCGFPMALHPLGMPMRTLQHWENGILTQMSPVCAIRVSKASEGLASAMASLQGSPKMLSAIPTGNQGCPTPHRVQLTCGSVANPPVLHANAAAPPSSTAPCLGHRDVLTRGLCSTDVTPLQHYRSLHRSQSWGTQAWHPLHLAWRRLEQPDPCRLGPAVTTTSLKQEEPPPSRLLSCLLLLLE